MQIREVMASNPLTLDSETSIQQAAQAMRDHDIGDVIVLSGSSLSGIVTDRDIAIRAVAEGKSPSDCTIGEICTPNPATVSPDTTLNEAANTMRQQAVRRLPVVENESVVGIVSLGDLAIELDESSALADISAAKENN